MKEESWFVYRTRSDGVLPSGTPSLGAPWVGSGLGRSDGEFMYSFGSTLVVGLGSGTGDVVITWVDSDFLAGLSGCLITCGYFRMTKFGNSKPCPTVHHCQLTMQLNYLSD